MSYPSTSTTRPANPTARRPGLGFGEGARGIGSVLRDIVALSKPRIVLMSALLASLGLFLAPVAVSLARTVFALVGVSLAVAAANALNMYLERDLDGRMARTRRRPLPDGRLGPATALLFGLVCALASAALLWTRVNPVTALIATLAISSYVLLYTPLKRVTHLALLVGTLPGAAPPLLGWTAASGTIDPGALALFAVMVIWQIPHFLAISLYRKHDYGRAGLPVTPIVRGEAAARRQALLAATLLAPVSLVLAPLGVADWPTTLVVALAGALFALHGWHALQPAAGARGSRAFFLSSLAYLPAIGITLFLGNTIL